MIKYKSLFGWREVTKEQALNLANHIYWGAVALGEENEKIDYINSRFEGVEFKVNNNKIEIKE